MRRKPGNEIAKAKLELQDVIEELLTRHRLDMFGHYKYDLRLRMPSRLVINNADSYASVGHYYEPDGGLVLFIRKLDRYMRIGLYYDLNGDHMCDPVLTIECINRVWHPIGIERIPGYAALSYAVGCKRVMYPDKVEEFMSFQRMFAQYIREQEWLKNGVRIKRK
ncbi:hypothetical protein [Candidatus Methanoperedens nitratireducens]|uniref:Uncharacterized protein n=1 Tax=Candidatus Methanoperedens nitratireducens TaxID=1392998 RepID=A0A284VIF9_9EURY|nr:hypothetical protein [Candidatus Methanoperedens nitroreducens]SNQ58979.1 hypothetical protein MNV_1020013 [Candidatus Methanoperedens nitroreducens]